MRNIFILLKDFGGMLRVVNASYKSFNIKQNNGSLIEMECLESDWAIEWHEQYKSREPGYNFGTGSELRAKLFLLRSMNSEIPHNGGYSMTKLYTGPSVKIVMNEVEYRLEKNSFSFCYLGGDTYYGGTSIFPLAEYLKKYLK